MELKDTVLGIELGSTRIKAVLVDRNFRPLVSSSFAWENQLVDGVWTYAMDQVYQGLRTCYADLKRRYEPLDGGMAVAVDDFCGFGADALFLARFASPRPGERVVDLGTGCGILPVLLLRDSAAAHVTGVEIQPAAAALARRSVARSGLDGRAAVLCASWTDLDGLLPREGFHLVVCNPPYFPPGSGRESASPAARLARHEQPGTLDEVVAAASRLLRFGGRFCLCHRPERLADVVAALRRRGLEPKRLLTVQGAAASAPWLLLLEAKKGGKPGLRWEPPWLQDQPAHRQEIYGRNIS